MSPTKFKVRFLTLENIPIYTIHIMRLALSIVFALFALYLAVKVGSMIAAAAAG